MALIRGSQISGSVASASYAVTASYALNAGDIFPFSGSAVITGSLLVTGGITGSMNITNLYSGSSTQSFPNQSNWTVQHNLNSAYVVVQTYDSNEEQMLPQTIDLTDANTTTITFPIALSGTAVVMVGTPLAGGGGGGNTSVSASYATNASLLDGIDSSAFATTGSNTFRADQIVSGSIYVSGGLSVGDSNIRIDTDEAFPFVVGYGSNTPNIKTNTVLGYFVLNNNTTGNYNVGIGFTAMQSNTTGHSNVAIGPGALGSNDTGFRNVGIGFEAAGAAVVNNSVALGYWALRGGGGNSIAVGYEAGRYSTPTSYRNVYLGYGAGPTASVTESDKLYIANAAGTPLIGGDFSTKTVTVSGSVQAMSGFTGSLLGTASHALTIPVGYLSAYHTASMTVPVINTPYSILFSTTDFSYGVSISGSLKDKIKIETSGIYDIQFSAQINKTNNNAGDFYIWLSKNGSDVSYTNTGLHLGNVSGKATVAAWNFYVSASAGDYYQLMYGASEDSIYIEYDATAAVGPQIPAIILTVGKIA